MTDVAPQANEIAEPPKKRRWGRWAVLAVAICMGSGAGWWFWPRGDARFVGRWMMREENETEPVGELVLRRHGVGSYTAPGNDYVVSFRWHVEAGNFVSKVDNRFWPLRPGTAYHFAGVRGRTPHSPVRLLRDCPRPPSRRAPPGGGSPHPDDRVPS